MEAVARGLLGEPNKHLSSADELRFGAHGSMSVDLTKGTWFDHEGGEGGGVLDLVTRETQLKNGAAVGYMKENLGLAIEDGRAPIKTHKRIVATYDYADEDGEVHFQVVRYEPKDFRQRRPDPTSKDGWSWSVKGVKPIPYRMADLWSLEGRGTAYIVEGEKDADALAHLGVVATCNAGGAGKWPADLAPSFAGLDVIILPDNDAAGRNHAGVVSAALKGVARSVRILDLPGLPPKGDVSDWIKAGGTGEELNRLAGERARIWAPAPPESRFGAIPWAAMDTVTMRQDWQVEDLFFSGDTVLAFGASGSGKSFLAVDMGLAIARGVPFLGKATRKGSVLYQAGEGGRGLLKRLKAYRQHHGLWSADVPFVLLPETVNLFSGDGDVEAFGEECLAWKAALPEPLALIVIDTFSTASTGANENASEDMSRMLAAGKRLNTITGAAIMWVHHKNAAGDRERGHTSLRANVDSAIEITRDEETNYRTLRVVKIKDGEDGEKIGFQLQPVDIGTYDDGKTITSCVVVPAQVGDPRTGERRTKLSVGQTKFLKILDDAITQRGGVIPSGERAPPNTYGVEWAKFRDIYKVINGAGMADDAIRQAVRRDGDALFNKGLIDKEDHWIWITRQGMELL
jgi:hypothetical protein